MIGRAALLTAGLLFAACALHAQQAPARSTYTLKPYGQKDIYVTPENTLFEGPSRLIDDRTGEVVGVAVSVALLVWTITCDSVIWKPTPSSGSSSTRSSS